MIDNDIEEQGDEFGDQDDDGEFGFKDNADDDPTAQINDMIMSSKDSEWMIEWALLNLTYPSSRVSLESPSPLVSARERQYLTSLAVPGQAFMPSSES